ncbi:SDR family oxidoreductase, partial [Saccharothrix sp. MB29]|nr:SDR family oxidoreductase [Saccharothrix sp. MB29]
HLARRPGACLVLVGRDADDPRLVERAHRLAALGARVLPLGADLTDAASTASAVAAARARFGRIDGVLHLAGVTRDGLFVRKGPGDLRAVVEPKLLGAVHLDEAIGDAPLDFFAVASSLTAAIGNTGQSDYAYANGALEDFARRRAERPDRAGASVAIGWPMWAEGGMRLPEAALRRVWDVQGTAPMPTADGLAVLDRLLSGPDGVAVVVHGDPARIDDLVPPPVEPARAEPARTEPVRVERAPEVVDDGAIAVIGLAGRYPQAPDLDAFWRNLLDGVDSVVEVPAERWDHDAHFDPRPGLDGRTYSRWGGFLDGVDLFDHAFFGISRRDAERMDPQERLFLTTCWQAMEDAGQVLGGRDVGVFAGVTWSHYQLYQDAGVAPVAMHASVANRVSHVLDLTGPSLSVDTACSSSLTAVHLAVQAIRRGECELAFAGGVNTTVHPQKYLQLSQGQFLSPDGRCRSFGAGAAGYVPGEGVGVVLLKPLSRALADGDHVHGVIRGTALNHTGRTGGFTVPSPTAQTSLIRRALTGAGVAPATVGYVEAHGTGTSLGDPIELDGLRAAFGTDLPASSVAIGSVKSNIGHLEAAAGIAGLTKVLLQMKHRTLVPSLHADEPNPHLRLAGSPFAVQRDARPWLPVGGDVLRAGISAFGAGGANSH